MGGEGVGREMAQGVQPAAASQRLGLSAADAGGQIPQVPGPEFYPMEWISNGPRSNLEGGLVPGVWPERATRRGRVLESYVRAQRQPR